MRLLEFNEFEIRDYRWQQRGPAIFLATRCHGGKSSSSSQANPTTITQSGTGQQASGSYSVAGGQGSLNVGAGGNYLEQGASQTQTTVSGSQVGAKNATQLSNVTNSGDGNINITDNGAVQAALDLAGRTVQSGSNAFQNALDTITQQSQNAINANESNLGNILAAANKLEATSSSGASAQLLNTLLYLGMGVIVIVGAWLIFGRK